jgi:hypothetical protein
LNRLCTRSYEVLASSAAACALPAQAGHLHLLGPGTVAGLGGHGLGRIPGRLGLGQLGLHLGTVHFHQQVAGLDDLTLAHIHLGDAGRDLGRDIGLTRLHLALEIRGRRLGSAPEAQMMKISTAAMAISAATGRRLACFGTSGLEGDGVGTGVFMERLL